MCFGVGAVTVVQQASDGWTVATAIGTLLAAAATAVSAVIIAFQAVQTRKSVEQTNLALDVAKQQASLAQRSIVEGQKALIASQLPRLSVRVLEQAFNVWLEDNNVNGVSSRTMVEPGQVVFTMPGDRGRKLTLQYKLEGSNDGPMRSDVEFYFFMNDASRMEKRVLMPGESWAVESSRTETVEEWIRIAGDYDPQRKSDSGLPLSREIFRMFYAFLGEEGANEGHPISAGGTILEPVPGNASGWTVRTIVSGEYGQPLASPDPMERHYYGSRSRSEELV